MWLCWRIMNGSFGVEKSPHLLMAFTISKLKWLYHINSGTTKVYSSPLRAVEETKQLLLFVYATQQHMSAGPSMALGGLGSAWSLKVAAVWTNLPVSHVTPSVSLGMWEDSAHPNSCHTVFRAVFFFFFFKRLLCHCCRKRAGLLPWASRVDDCIFFKKIWNSTAPALSPPPLTLFKKVSYAWLYLYSL